jgi:hypothetical protein
MAAVDMFANDNVISVADNNLRGRRNSARKHSNGRT